MASHVAGPAHARDDQHRPRPATLDRAERHGRELHPLYEALAVTTNPIPLKAALNLLGHEVGGLRLPLVEADERADAPPSRPRSSWPACCPPATA